MGLLEIIIIAIVIFVLLPYFGIVIPEPLNKIIGIIIGVVVLFWVLGLLGVV